VHGGWSGYCSQESHLYSPTSCPLTTLMHLPVHTVSWPCDFDLWHFNCASSRQLCHFGISPTVMAHFLPELWQTVTGQYRSLNLTYLSQSKKAMSSYKCHGEVYAEFWRFFRPPFLLISPHARQTLKPSYITIAIRLYHDAFDYDGSDRNYDSTAIRLRYHYDEKLTCSFLLTLNWKQARAIRRSRIVVVS